MLPMYYLLILSDGAHSHIAALGLACSAVAGPLAYLATPDWSLPFAGLAGGSVAYLLFNKT